MNNKNPKIIIEEDPNAFLFEKNQSKLKISFNRISFIFFIFFIIFIIYSIHLLHLGSRSAKAKLTDTSILSSDNLYRADIIDRNGRYLSKTVSSIDIGISTKKVIDKKRLIINLKYIFPDKDFKKIKSQLESKNFFYLEKKISEENYEKIMKLGDKSIQPEEKLTRIYPEKNLFSHIIGQIDDNNNGISGLEKSLDIDLKNIKKPIKLTVDKDIQYLIRTELIKFNQIFNTIGSAAILMNVNNGEILSLVSLPDFNPNKREKIIDSNYINRVTKGVYEFGSVFKTFTLAAALNEKIIQPETEFNDLPKMLNCAGFQIREYDKKIPSDLTAEQILVRSGNIGSVRIAQQLGEEKFKLFLSKIGVVEQINFDIEETGTPIKFNWGKCPLATASFGHGITTTLLQLAKAYSIIVNGGYDINPSLLMNSKKEKKEKILDDEVSRKILPILRKIVTTKEGTASLANVNGYEVGGKTGTAEKSFKGSYSKKKINSFVAIFPTSKPRFVLALMLDEPKTNENYIYHYRDGSNIKYKGTPFNTAGWTTVEVTGQILEKIGPILATKYSEVN
ncbi:peptidoglycan D,D-transpeptidase FtsI family protein [Candidatus Pelagibacter sp. HIMB1483]|uniref:peptidoglycan D,D-transpeptidase FtsI family protein n=1 Tax=Candidatus Pelagibacter sp. HIMB1483 TaxID=3415414 RepID=UPI003F84A4C3